MNIHAVICTRDRNDVSATTDKLLNFLCSCGIAVYLLSGAKSIFKAYKLSYLADSIGSMSLEAFDGRIDPFDELVHMLRPHKGQLKTAANIREMLAGS